MPVDAKSLEEVKPTRYRISVYFKNRISGVAEHVQFETDLDIQSCTPYEKMISLYDRNGKSYKFNWELVLYITCEKIELESAISKDKHAERTKSSDLSR